MVKKTSISFLSSKKIPSDLMKLNVTDTDYIHVDVMDGKFVKEKTNGMDIVYGGGLKQDNAEMLASIDEIDGGLIALTRFQGEIGYYPEEYLEIIRLYMGRENNK